MIDENPHPRRSRYSVADGYEDRFARGAEQEMLDKENIRQWLIKEHGFSGMASRRCSPTRSASCRRRKYIEVFERLTGETFESEVGASRPDPAEPAGEGLSRSEIA